MNLAIGKTRWAIAEGYIPPESTGEGRALESHETVCILNAGDTDAQIAITVFFTDRERPDRIASPFRPCAHAISASTISRFRSPSRGIPITPA